MTDLSEFFSNVEAATQPRGKGKLQPPPYDPYQNPRLGRDAAVGTARMLAPSATSLALGEPEAPMQDIPADPGNYKIPPTSDQRVPQAGVEMLSLGLGGGTAAPARAGAGMAANMAARFAPRAVRFAEGAVPSEGNALMRNTVAGAGAAALMPGEAQAQAPQGQDIKQLQMQLKQSGDYKGNIDGKWGPIMEAAQNAFNDRKRQQEADDRQIKNLEAQASLGVANAKTKESEAQIAETERLRKAKDKADADREAGMARLREVETNLSPTSKNIRAYSGPAGYGIGAGVGALARVGVVKGANYLSSRAARKAEDLFMREGANGKMTKVPAKTDQEKVSRVNEFARKGGGEEPFDITPTVHPGFAANPNATPFKQLYAPNRASNLATDIGIPAAFGAEAGWAEMMPKPAAHEELLAATEAANKDPSEINIQRLQDAKDNVALWEGVGNFGRGGAVGYGSMALKMKRAPTAPNMAPAEAEKMSLEKTLRSLAPTTKKGLAAPAQSAPVTGTTQYAPNVNTPMPPNIPSSGAQFMGMRKKITP